MIRKNKWTLIVTFIIILVSILAGLILRDQLLEQMPTLWGTNGTPDGWSGKILGILLPIPETGIKPPRQLVWCCGLRPFCPC